MLLTTEVISTPKRYLIKIRFPFICSEIFNCEINSILDKFFDAPEKAKKLETEEDEDDEIVKQKVGTLFK
jgi:hypothetical protein